MDDGAFTSIDIDILDSDGIVLDAIGFHEGDVVIIDREGKEWTAGNGKDAQPEACRS